jgi:hypothetical protein
MADAGGDCVIEVRMFGFEPITKKANCAEGQKIDFALQCRNRRWRSAWLAWAARKAAETSLPRNWRARSVRRRPLPARRRVDGQNGNEAFLVSGSLSQGLAQNARPDFGMYQMGGPGMAGGPGGTSSARRAYRRWRPGGGGFGGPPGGGFGGPEVPEAVSAGAAEALAAIGGGAALAVPARSSATAEQPSQIHGMAFFTLGNSVLDAKPFSINGEDLLQPAYASSRFGFLLGGPLVIPKIVKAPSTFFYLNYTGTRARAPYSAVETVPTAAERTGRLFAGRGEWRAGNDL